MDLAAPSRLRFAEFEANFGSRELFRDGIRIPLQEKPFLVLSALLQSPQQLITREQFAQCAWADSHVELDFCLNTAIKKLRRALDDPADCPRFVETVGKLGYRFIGEIRKPGELPSVNPARVSTPHSNSLRLTRLMVLPFEYLGVSPDGFFAKGLTLHILTRLARRYRHVAVIVPPRDSARSSQQIRQQLHVDYVLAGSVLRSAGCVRVDVELIDRPSQSCIWAETYMRPESEPIAIQDDIARHITKSTLRILLNGGQTSEAKADVTSAAGALPKAV